MMTKSKPKDSDFWKAIILEVVENQLRDGEPPETRQTYERLLVAGYSDEEARRLIGCVLSSEFLGVLQNNESYNRDRYVAALERLPVLPWE